MPTRQRSNRNPRDYTGRQSEELALENQAELAERANEIGLLRQVQAAELAEVVDYTKKSNPEPTEVDVTDVEVGPTFKELRVNAEIEQMTFGHGNEYNFKPGRVYRVPIEVANHLETLGYVWH